MPRGKVEIGEKIIIIGTGGIGFDVATHVLANEHQSAKQWLTYWGINHDFQARGLLIETVTPKNKKQVIMMQRSEGPPGQTLGKTTGWAHRFCI